MRIVFDPATLHQSKRGSITGVVYFDFGGAEAFPIEGWNDFVVVIAGWWLSAMAQVTGGSGEAQLRFMDGPYWVTVRAQHPVRLQLHCIEDRWGATEVIQAEVNTEELASELRRFAHDVAQACATAGFDSPELAELRTVLAELKGRGTRRANAI